MRRLIPALGALACLAPAFAVSSANAARLPLSLILAIEAAGALLLAVALVRRWPRLVVPAVGTVGLAVGATLALRGPAAAAPALGVALLGSAELAYWSLDVAEPATERFWLGAWRGLRLLGMLGLGILAGLGVLAASDLGVSGGFDLTLAGAVAALLLLLGLAWLQRRHLAEGGWL